MNTLKYWIVLLCSVLLAVVVGCVQTPTATPDIEATITARVQATLAAQTPTPNIQATLTAAVQAAIQAMHTPVAPTPTVTHTPTLMATLTPTPTSLGSISILNKAKKAMAELHSYKFAVKTVTKAQTEEVTLEFPITTTGYFHAPDRYHMTESGNILDFLDLGVEKFQIGDKLL